MNVCMAMELLILNVENAQLKIVWRVQITYVQHVNKDIIWIQGPICAFYVAKLLNFVIYVRNQDNAQAAQHLILFLQTKHAKDAKNLVLLVLMVYVKPATDLFLITQILLENASDAKQILVRLV